MDSPTEAQGIDLLFRKLGHNITEIRIRALESILSKLDHGLLHDADIVQERQLMVRLLEWFNFQPSPKQDQVLRLLERLTKHSSACDLLVSIGGLQFLSRVRIDIDTNLRPQVDVVLDRLLHVADRDLLQASSAPKRCIYGKISEHDKEKEEVMPPPQANLNYGYFNLVEEPGADDTVSTITPPIPNTFGVNGDVMKASEPECLRFYEFPWHSLTGTDRHVLASTGASLCSPSAHLVRNACAFLLDVIFRDFPAEIFLQRPSIVQTLLTLIGSRPGGQLMTGALECLQALAEGLLCRLHFFQDPAFYCPRQGLPFHGGSKAGSQFSTLESFSEIELASRSEAEGVVRPERSGGDGRDGQSSSSSSSATTSTQATPLQRGRNHNPFGHSLNSLTWNSNGADDETENDITALRRSQIFAPQFCLSALTSALPSLKTDSARLALSLLQATSPLIHLLACLVRAKKLWQDRSTIAQSMHAQVRQLLEIVGDVLLYHYSLDSGVPSTTEAVETMEWVSKKWPASEARMHRLVYQAVAPMLLKLLHAVLPVDMCAREIKSSLSRALYVVACDEALRVSCSGNYEIAEAYLEQCSPEKFDIVQRIRKVVDSFTHTHMFLRDFEESHNSPATMETMELAESSMDGLPYHSDVTHLKLVLQAISQLFIQDSNLPGQSSLQSLSKRILLRLMAHPLVSIRRTIYEECLNIARAAINVTAAAETLGHTASRACRFLLDTEVLYELSCHGVGDSSRLVSHPAQELIALLLQGRLLMAEDVWHQFCFAVKPVFPILQAYTGETEILRSCINVFISPAEHPSEEWVVDCIRACLRGLMLKHRGSRSAAASRLQQILTKDDIVSHVTGLTDLLVVDTPLSLIPKDETDCFRIRRCVFQEEAVIRMLSVFRSTSTEASVRIGALRQLATMLDDPGLHKTFLANLGLESVIDKLKEMVQDELSVLTDDSKPALSACIMILKLILRTDMISREKLSHDRTLLIALLRAADLCRLSVASSIEVAVVIALLVFHELLRDCKRPLPDDAKVGGSKCETVELSLPASVVTRYQIPFLCPTHHAVSIYRTLACPPSPLCDPLTSGPPAAALRVGWNMARCDGDVVSLCEEQSQKEPEEYTSALDDIINLQLTEEDRLFLTFSHPTSASGALLDAVTSSQSHAAASHAFLLMRISLMSIVSAPYLIQSILHDFNKKWKGALVKFLQVAPSCYEDEVLLTNLASLLDEMLCIIETNNSGILDNITNPFVNWLVTDCILSSAKTHQMLGQSGSPILKVLESSEPLPEPVSSASNANEPHMSSVTVHRHLCKNILCLLSRIARMLPFEQNVEGTSMLTAEACECFHRELRTVILVRLRLADAPRFYDLPSMEVTLQCLVHISANRIACCNQNKQLLTDPISKILSQQLLGTLLEVVSAFHIGSGASSLSYMGKGVSRCATQCILHLAREMATFGITDWPNLLEYSVPSQSGQQEPRADKLGLEWLIPLWSARDPRTRFAGLAIATVAAKNRQGVITLSNGFQRCTGGLWNMALSVLLDHSECSAVRKQACDLLRNMMVYKFDAASAKGPSWQGPMVQDEATGSTITGLPALLALLHHAHVYDHLVLMLSSYHPESTVRSPIVILSSAPDRASDCGTSVVSIAGSGSNNSQSGMTPLTQISVSNAFPSISSVNKETFASSQVTNEASAQQTSDNNGDHLSSSPMASLPEEWRALTSPGLVASVCDLFCNFVSVAPHDTVNAIFQKDLIYCLNGLLNIERIEALFLKLSLPSNDDYNMEVKTDAAKKLRQKLLARDLLAQHKATTQLVTMCVVAERSVTPRLTSSETTVVKNILAVLKLQPVDDTWVDALARAHRASFEFIASTILQNIKNPLSATFKREWPAIYAGTKAILKKNTMQELTTSCLQALAVLLRSECMSTGMDLKPDVNLTWVLENTVSGDESNANELCQLLVGIFERLIVNPSAGIQGTAKLRLTAVSNALQNLFACSSIAQNAAVDYGFLERCLDELKQLQIKMSLHFTTSLANKCSVSSSLDSKSSVTIEECEIYVEPILLIISLLTNLLHGQVELKKQAIRAGVGQVLSQLWSWTSNFQNLLLALLKFLTSFTAHCPQASAMLASNHSSGQPSIATALVKLCREVHGSVLSRAKLSTPLLHVTFTVLVNCASSQESRAILWKMGLLELFPFAADRGQHPKRSKQQTFLLEHWLKLLLALSFHSDGQLNILKVKDIFHVLVELHGSNTNPKLVLLIIRNLCFHAPSKNRISSNAPLVRLLMTTLNEEENERKTAASSALLSLLCNNQKAKVHLKGAGLAQTLQNALARIALADKSDDYLSESSFKECLSTMLKFMQA
ncbi:unnamed protein product [Clavelina lepadiformis]|uniref:Rotatin N-terminal domain-containing protein n=1 Tax=Clavelina lepadiformis TaxID=159417 RepID=A0ABP0GGM1_CLALP